MDYPSGRRQRLWEAMESCRCGSDDLRDPQFSDLAARLAEDPELRVQFQRLQAVDGAIKAAFASVHVPAGLTDRVSRRLAEAAPAVASPSVSASADSLVAPAITPVHSPAPLRELAGRFSRRRLLVGFAALSAAAALMVAVWIQTHPSRHETPDSVLEEAMDFFGQDNQPFGPLALQAPPPAEYPISRDMRRDIVHLQDVRWRHVEKFLGGPAVAYDLPTLGGRATLYVVERDVPGLAAMPPDSPMSTGGKSAAAWQAGNTLYVLVVEGDAGMYRSYLDQSRGPLT